MTASVVALLYEYKGHPLLLVRHLSIVITGKKEKVLVIHAMTR